MSLLAIPSGSSGNAGEAGFYPLNINQSLRFNDDDSAYLSRTPASAGNRKTWTWSGWVKRGNLGSDQFIFTTGTTTGSQGLYFNFNSDDKLNVGDYSSGYIWQKITSAVYRDVSSWYHIVISYNTTEATASDRIKLYVNGQRITAFSTDSNPSLNYDGYINGTAYPHGLGRFGGYDGAYLDGYLAEVHFTDGTAYTADDFGEFKSGVWVAKTPSVTYGTNGFHLAFADSAAIGDDTSGEGNDWAPNNFTASDVVTDSPTNNFAVFSPIDSLVGSVTDGNLQASTATSGSAKVKATFAIPQSGKWYFEITPTSSGNFSYVGIADGDANAANSVLYKAQDGTKRIDGAFTSYGATYTNNDVIGVAVNSDDGEVTFYKNNTSQGVISYSLEGKDLRPMVSDSSSSVSVTFTADFGQQDFTYTPPSGYLALSTANLPAPAIDPAQQASPADYFNTVLYTGDGNDDRSITGVGFQPDFVWFKQRSATRSHLLVDAIRGATQRLKSDTTDAEDTFADGCQAFESDGFQIGTNNTVNVSGGSYVAWNWKAGGTGVSNTDGTITSTVSANTESGFSIVSYTGNGSFSATVGHGLGQVPDLVIVKARTLTRNWCIKHKDLSSDKNLSFSTAAEAGPFGNGGLADLTSSSTFGFNGVSTLLSSNNNGDNYIAYCFHSVEGFSKFGSYTGNGSADGPFVYTGFRPAFILVKRTDSTASWGIFDATRNTFNAFTKALELNSSIAEVTATFGDMLSNGFKWRYTGAQNQSGGTYIYMAFAENPFKYANAR